MKPDQLLQHALLAAALGGSGTRLAEEAALAQQRESRIRRIACATGESHWTWQQRLDEARRAVELAERVGTEEGRASPAPTSLVVQRYIDAVEWRAMMGKSLPQDDDDMRRAAAEHLNATMLPGIA